MSLLIIFNLPTSLLFNIFGELLEIQNLARLDEALLGKKSSRKKYLDILQDRYFSSIGINHSNVNEIEYINWLVLRKISIRQLHIINPKSIFINQQHNILFQELKINFIEHLTITGNNYDIYSLIKRIITLSKRLKSLKFSNVLWLTYPKLRQFLKICGLQLEVFQVDTIRYLHSTHFIRIIPYLCNIKVLVLGRIELNDAMLTALMRYCRCLHTIQFMYCTIHNSKFIEFIESYSSTTTSGTNSSSVYNYNSSSSSSIIQTPLHSRQNRVTNSLTSIELSYNTSINMNNIATTIGNQCQDLIKLSLTGDYSNTNALNNDILTYITTQCIYLQYIDISKNNYITDTAIYSVTTNCTTIHTLNIQSCIKLTDLSIQYITQYCSNLCYLNISYNDNYTNNTLILLNNSNIQLLYNIVYLNISSCYRITSKVLLLEFIQKCKHLSVDNVITTYTTLA